MNKENEQYLETFKLIIWDKLKQLFQNQTILLGKIK